MTATAIYEIYKSHVDLFGKTLIVNGRIRTIRDSKTFGFIELNDGSYLKNLQIIFDDNLPNFEEVRKLGISSSLTIEGELVKSPGAKQPFELKAKTITIVGTSPSDYPLQKKGHTMEYLRTIGHLRPRTNTFSAVFRVRSLLAFAIHKYFNEHGFIYAHTPIITASDAEGAGEMFQVTTLDLDRVAKGTAEKPDYSADFFGKQASLTVSGQLEGEIFATAFGKIYTFGPTFRAENSNTARHASEFWMIEPEIAFANLKDDMDLAEDLLKFVFQYILDNAEPELEFFTKFVNPEVKDRLEKFTKSAF
jgi:asparaginyl-tRNA synthetase